ncbi:helix-turn-helix domain-containing protein [Embleya hyalina]|uniref:Transcriptional regulator n=1 Tax=Embleya hyalina TaxID=516124 RepID=A0A401Z390_9ACTN|nr:helix-turn-helix transcriptional regulator [Embleya hyalina]GCE01266.1 transcriptional regulator [Embleya hyalina]
MSDDQPTTSNAQTVYGRHLRQRRNAANLSADDLGAIGHCSGSLVYQIERGERRPAWSFTRAVDTRFGGDGLLCDLHDLIDNENPIHPKWFGDLLRAEPRATRIRLFEPQALPGLLQTESYARALISGMRPVNASVDELVAGRMARQRLLFRQVPPQMWALIDEPVLLRLAKMDPAVVKEQLEHLIGVAEHSHIVLQVLPITATVHAAMNGSFLLMTLPEGEVGYIESVTTGQLISEASGVSEVERRYDLAKADALSPGRTVNHLRKLLENPDEHCI